MTAHGGEYRLCWCGKGEPDCGTANRFLVDMGRLTIVGPSLLASHESARTCVSGQTYTLDGIRGLHMTSTDSFLILETCAAPQHAPHRFAGVGAVSNALGETVVVSWGALKISGQGGEYRLCWCAGGSGSSCLVQGEHLTDAGSLTLLGPYPLMQDRTCVSGQTCRLDGLVGVGLSVLDGLWILDTCGSSETISRLGIAGHIGSVTASGAAVSWDAVAMTVAGGQYRLCWCASTFECETSPQYVTDLGKLDIVGAYPLQQDRTCVGGQLCSLDGIVGQYLAAGDKTMALDTCGVTRGLPRFANGGLVSEVRSSGAIVAFGAAVSAAGGEYRLCWCMAGMVCSELENFRVDVGRLTLVAPSPLSQDRTCVSGEICSFDGIRGTGLAASDRVFVLDTCGLHSTITSVVHTFLSVDSSGAIASVGSVPVTNVGGTYRLCWCASTYQCSVAADFGFDMGTLTLVGPYPFAQHRTCVSGRTCQVDGVVGLGLSAADSVLLLDSCATTLALPRFNNEGLVVSVSGSGMGLTWTGAASTAAGGAYRMCWKSGAKLLSGASWIPTEHLVDIGIFTLIAPSPLSQDRTCVSGQTCRFEGVIGQHLSSSDSILVLDTCGTRTSEARFPAAGAAVEVVASGAIVSWGSLAITATGGQYRLCWCSGSAVGTAGPASCESPANFVTDMGELLLVGASPLEQGRTCVSGRTCSFEGIGGQSLSSVDRFVVLDTCGDSNGVPRFAGFGAVSLVENSGARITFTEAQVSSSGGQYRLCWCSFAHFTCSVVENFRTDTGELLLLGPSPLSQDRTCIAGQTCALEGLVGQHLASGDRVLVLDTCSSTVMVPRFPDHGLLEVVEAGAASRVTWSGAIVSAAGGQYRLCWCPASAASCNVATHEHIVDFGGLTLVGVSPVMQDRTCVSGRTCSLIAIGGMHISHLDTFLMLDSCGQQSTIARSPLAGESPLFRLESEGDGSNAGWLSAKVTSAGGLYRLCWCASSVYSCSVAADFVTDVGALTLMGVSPLSQHRTLYIHIYIYIYMCVYVCIYIYIYICIYTYYV